MTYTFTFGGETREGLTPTQIRKWTGLTMSEQTIAANLDFIQANKDDKRYPMLANTPHGLQVAAAYRVRIGRAKSLQASRRSPFAGRSAR